MPPRRRRRFGFETSSGGGGGGGGSFIILDQFGAANVSAMLTRWAGVYDLSDPSNQYANLQISLDVQYKNHSTLLIGPNADFSQFGLINHLSFPDYSASNLWFSAVVQLQNAVTASSNLSYVIGMEMDESDAAVQFGGATIFGQSSDGLIYTDAEAYTDNGDTDNFVQETFASLAGFVNQWWRLVVRVDSDPTHVRCRTYTSSDDINFTLSSDTGSIQNESIPVIPFTTGYLTELTCSKFQDADSNFYARTYVGEIALADASVNPNPYNIPGF